jgi:hypothetical protein
MTNQAIPDATEWLAGNKSDIGSPAPTRERWCLASVFHGEAFPHPHSPPGRQRSQDGNCQRDFFDGSYFSAPNTA